MYRRCDLGQVARALRILDGLRGFKHGRRLADLADEVGTSERTVRRDLDELRDAGYEIETLKLEGRSAARLIERSYSSVPITRRERFTLLAIRSVFDVLRGTPLLDDVHSVLAKLEQRMSRDERDEHAAFGERFIYIPDHGSKAYDGKEDVIDALQTGILSRKLVRYRYADARGRATRGHLAPYAMVLYRHGLYVVGRKLTNPDDDAASAPLAAFAVERFADAEHLRSSSFHVPAGFRIGELLHGTFGLHVGDGVPRHQIVIEFSREKALLVSARTWQRGQSLESLSDGRVRLSFACTSLAPVVSWVLEWGPHAIALEPPALVEMITRELDQARANYRGGKRL